MLHLLQYGLYSAFSISFLYLFFQNRKEHKKEIQEREKEEQEQKRLEEVRTWIRKWIDDAWWSHTKTELSVGAINHKKEQNPFYPKRFLYEHLLSSEHSSDKPEQRIDLRTSGGVFREHEEEALLYEDIGYVENKYTEDNTSNATKASNPSSHYLTGEGDSFSWIFRILKRPFYKGQDSYTAKLQSYHEMYHLYDETSQHTDASALAYLSERETDTGYANTPDSSKKHRHKRNKSLNGISNSILNSSYSSIYHEEDTETYEENLQQDWNERFQAAVAKIRTFNQSTSLNERIRGNLNLLHLSKDFIFTAQMYGKIIISEYYLPLGTLVSLQTSYSPSTRGEDNQTENNISARNAWRFFILRTISILSLTSS